MGKLLTLILLISSGGISNAQNHKMVYSMSEKIFLKQAFTQISGPVANAVNDSKIYSLYADFMMLSQDEKIGTTTPAYAKNNSVLETKFQHIAEMGYSFGVKNFNIDYLLINAIYAYKIYPCFSVGVGTGLRYALDVSDALIPFFVDFRVNPNKKNNPLYMALDIGYSMDITHAFKSQGFYFLVNPVAGVRFELTKNSSFNIGIGYDIQKYYMQHTGYHVKTGTTINTAGININTGICF